MLTQNTQKTPTQVKIRSSYDLTEQAQSHIVNNDSLYDKVKKFKKMNDQHDSKIERAHQSDLKKMKQQFARELQSLIDREVKKVEDEKRLRAKVESSRSQNSAALSSG